MWKTLPAVLMPLFLLAFLTGCSTKYIPAPVDSELTRHVAKDSLTADATWRELAESYVLRGEAIDQCNAQLEAIKKAHQ